MLLRFHSMNWHTQRIPVCSACRKLLKSHITIWGGYVYSGHASGRCLVNTLIKLAVIPVKI
jgi:hypothetical protein